MVDFRLGSKYASAVYFYHFITPRVTRMCHFWTQIGPICPNESILEKNLVDKRSSYHSYRTKFQKSKSEINLLMKY